MTIHFSPKVLRKLKELGFDYSNLKVVPFNETSACLIENFAFPMTGNEGDFQVHIAMEVQDASIAFVRSALVKVDKNDDAYEDWVDICYKAIIPSRAEMIDNLSKTLHTTRIAHKFNRKDDPHGKEISGKSPKFR